MSVDESFSGRRDEYLDSSEPVAKRTRYASKKLLVPEISKVEENISDEPTILNVLNEDCWKIILDYVKLQDLARSERVSRRWRSVVLCYLQGIHLCLSTSFYNIRETRVHLSNCRVIDVPADRFKAAIMKFGRTIVSAECRSAAILRALSKHCPDIEDISIHLPQRHNLKTKMVPFNKVRRISIMDVRNFSDRHIAKFLGYGTVKEFEVNENDRMTGSCLSELKSNLQLLEIKDCKKLDFNHFIAASERLSEMTKLKLTYSPLSILENLDKVLEKTPKLEYLGLVRYPVTAKVGALVDAICRLSKLKHLNLYNNRSVTDQWLEAVGRCCGELKTVSVGDCRGVSAAGVLGLCRGAGRTLAALDASSNDHITEDDVARCVTYCPKLEIFNVQYSPLVARHLPLVVAAVRRGGPRSRPLRLHLSKLVMAYQQPNEPPVETCADLIVDFGYNVFKCGELP